MKRLAVEEVDHECFFVFDLFGNSNFRFEQFDGM
jgi:hypothetical protein